MSRWQASAFRAFGLLALAATARAADESSQLLAQGDLQDKAGKIEVRRTGNAQPVLVLRSKEGRCSFRLQTWSSRATLKSHVPIASLEGKRMDCSPQWQERIGKSEEVRGLFKPTGGSKRGVLVFSPPEQAPGAARAAVQLPVRWVRLGPVGGEQ